MKYSVVQSQDLRSGSEPHPQRDDGAFQISPVAWLRVRLARTQLMHYPLLAVRQLTRPSCVVTV